MGFAILLALVIVPLVEIGVFISVGGAIGLWPTIAIVVLTAVAGTMMLRRQGLATLQRAREALAQQRMPMQELFDGACLLVAGALLLTPGFVTDGIGFVLMVPPLRALIGGWLWRMAERSGRASGHGQANGRDGFDGGPAGGRDSIIEGDYRTVDGDDGDKSPTGENRGEDDNQHRGNK